VAFILHTCQTANTTNQTPQTMKKALHFLIDEIRIFAAIHRTKKNDKVLKELYPISWSN
jgi:hypothetical protein